MMEHCNFWELNKTNSRMINYYSYSLELVKIISHMFMVPYKMIGHKVKHYKFMVLYKMISHKFSYHRFMVLNMISHKFSYHRFMVLNMISHMNYHNNRILKLKFKTCSTKSPLTTTLSGWAHWIWCTSTSTRIGIRLGRVWTRSVRSLIAIRLRIWSLIIIWLSVLVLIVIRWSVWRRIVSLVIYLTVLLAIAICYQSQNQKFNHFFHIFRSFFWISLNSKISKNQWF